MSTPTENLSKDTASVVDSLSAMIQKELTTYSDKGYYLLDPSESTIVVTSEDRMALVDWCYGVVDHYQFSRESVASAMEMVDRFLSMPNNTTTVDEALRDQNKFQLLIVTALYVSIKANEHVVISSDVFAEMSASTPSRRLKIWSENSCAAYRGDVTRRPPFKLDMPSCH